MTYVGRQIKRKVLKHVGGTYTVLREELGHPGVPVYKGYRRGVTALVQRADELLDSGVLYRRRDTLLDTWMSCRGRYVV